MIGILSSNPNYYWPPLWWRCKWKRWAFIIALLVVGRVLP